MAETSAAQVYRSLAPRVLGYLRGQGVADADDILGEVFLHVARDIGKFKGDDDDALRRWVFSIAHNRVIDERRRQARRPRVGAGEVPDAAAPEPPDPFDPALVEALAALTADQRECVMLRFVADLPLEAVARITGRKVGAVKALQHRALANLARAVSIGASQALMESDE
jgi:RNA polymerase sigma-70 factor (ECF subfamily)